MDNPPTTPVTGAGTQSSQGGTAPGARQTRQGGLAGRDVSAMISSSHRPEPLLPAGIAKRTDAQVPATGHSNMAPGMRVAPCPAPPSCLADGNPGAAGAGRSNIVRFRQPSSLAAIAVTDEAGVTLFRGLRHDTFMLDDLNKHKLQELPDEQLRPLLYDHLVYRRPPRASGQFLKQEVDSLCRQTRSELVVAEKFAPQIQAHAARHVAWATANAALAADPEKVKLALTGQVVNLSLFNISLLTPAKLTGWAVQQQAFAWLRNQGLIELHVQAEDGTQRKVPAQVGVRQIVLSQDLEYLATSLPGGNHVSLDADTSLLGGLGSDASDGDIGIRVGQMRARADVLSQDLAPLGRKHASIAQSLGRDHPECRKLTSQVSGIEEELACLECNARYLEQARQQLVDLRKKAGLWPPVGAGRNMAAARLALVAHLMGETPVLSCPAGSGLIGQLEPELVTLLRVTNGRAPELPPVG